MNYTMVDNIINNKETEASIEALDFMISTELELYIKNNDKLNDIRMLTLRKLMDKRENMLMRKHLTNN